MSLIQYTNITIQVPLGTTNHSDPSLLCTPASWTTIAVFYLGNYGAHAATSLQYPGEVAMDYLLQVLLAVIFPVSGSSRGLEAVLRCANFRAIPGDNLRSKVKAVLRGEFLECDQLRKAAKAGALCMVVKKGATVLDENDWEFVDSEDEDENIATSRNIHGVPSSLVNSLPSEYRFVLVPRNLPVISRHNGQGNVMKFSVSESWNPLKALVAIVQTLYASFTLYDTRGDQLTRYGYAAFGLTVIPYIVMSIINLLGSLATPSYQAVYLIRSQALVELETKHGFLFDGTVGEIEPGRDNTLDVSVMPTTPAGEPSRLDRFLAKAKKKLEDSRLQPILTFLTVVFALLTAICLLSFLAVAFLLMPVFGVIIYVAWMVFRKHKPLHLVIVPFFFPCIIPVTIHLAIIGALSRFREGESTRAQRAWLMTWFACGYAGLLLHPMGKPSVVLQLFQY